MSLEKQRILQGLGLESQVFSVDEINKVDPSTVKDGSFMYADCADEDVHVDNLLEETAMLINEVSTESETATNLQEAATMLAVLNDRIMNNLKPGLSMNTAIMMREAVAQHIGHLNTAVHPLPDPTVFEENPEAATEVSVEAMGEMINSTTAMIVATIKKIWEAFINAMKKLFTLMFVLNGKAKTNDKSIDALRDEEQKVVEDTPDNYIVIDKELRSFLVGGQPTNSLIEDVMALNEVLNNIFKPYLEKEIETAKTVAAWYKQLTVATIENDSAEIAEIYAKIEECYTSNQDWFNSIASTKEGAYLGGLDLVNKNGILSIELSKMTVRARQLNFLAFDQNKLDVLNSTAKTMLATTEELHKLYEQYQKENQQVINTITKAVENYARTNKLSRSKANRADNLMAKYNSHFNRSTANISNTINVFVRLSYTLVNTFIPKNIAILGNL